MTVKTRDALTSQANSTVQDNAVGDITPAEIRQMFIDIIDSAYITDVDNTGDELLMTAAERTSISNAADTTGSTWTGSHDFGGADDLEIPNGASITLDTAGQVGIDTTVTDFSAGVLQYYSGEVMGVVAMPTAEFSSPTDGYVVAYNASNDEFELTAPDTADIIATGSSAPASTPGGNGYIFIDTTNDVPYIATGNASSDDWDEVLTSATGSDLTTDTIVAGDLLPFFDDSASDAPKGTTAANFITDLSIVTLTSTSTLTNKSLTAPTITGALTVSGVTNKSTVRSDLGLAIGSDVQAYDADTLKADTSDNLTVGYTTTSYDIGTVTTGTTTLDFTDGNVQRLVNNGSFTLAPPSSGEGVITLDIENDSSAGTITTSGWDSVNGDNLDTTDDNQFRCSCSVINGVSMLIVVAFSGNS